MYFTTRKFFIFIGLVFFFFSTGNSVEAQETTQIAKVSVVSKEESAEKEPAPKKEISAEMNRTFTRVGVDQTQTEPLTLNEAIRRALENNNQIEVARDDVRYQETQLRSFLGFYDPVVNVTPNYTRNSTTGSEPTNDFRVNSNVTKSIRQTGGNYSVFFNNSRTENRFAQAQLSSGSTLGESSTSAINSSNLGIQFNQPLLRNFRIDSQRRLIRIQRKRLQQSDADFRRQTIEIISQVQRSYWDLVFALRDLQNRNANLNLSRENLRQIEARIEAGASAPLARAEVATELANREADVLIATQQVATAENSLKTLILRNPNAPEWNESLVPTDQPAFSMEPVDLNIALQEAVQNRTELRRLRLQKEINAIDIEYFRDQTKPQIDLTGSISLNGLAQSGNQNGVLLVPQFTGNDEILRQRLNTLLPLDQQIPARDIPIPPPPSYLVGGYNQALRNILRTDAPNYTVGVTFSFPIGNQTARANLAGARFLQEQNNAQLRSQEQNVIAEVRNAVQAVETARQRVLTARRAIENAEIQLEGERRLFEVGRSTNFLLFQRENTLANARNSLIRAETDYNKALADLQRATSTTFRVNNIEVESPTDNQ
ncbi:MAG TPA: TolC family protein [Pyrinomonadaceae bacterium]|nr:TolC family protein [Pyrinomonadaceae bacterium]